MVVALYFQYRLEEEPCALCIHIRIYMVSLMIVGLLGTLINSALARIILHWVCGGLSTGLALKCWELFGVERGFIEGSCQVDAGLPSWFPLESWIPSLFEARGFCGNSPEVALGITMAEMLMPVSITAALVAVSAAVINSVALIRDSARVER